MNCKKPCKNNETPTYHFALVPSLNGDKKFLPTRAHNTDTGWDVRSAQSGTIFLSPGEKILIPLGFRAFCPEGFWFEIKPRSSSFVKKHLNCLYGTIDESFEGQLMFAAQYLPPNMFITTIKKDIKNSQDLEINFGDAIGQIIPVKRQKMNVVEASNEEIEELYKNRNASRGIGGFGSSGS